MITTSNQGEEEAALSNGFDVLGVLLRLEVLEEDEEETHEGVHEHQVGRGGDLTKRRDR